MSRLKIGWAEEDISPTKKIYLEGQFAERISEYIEKPLTVTAMAIECGTDQMIPVSCDLVHIPYTFSDRVKKAFERNEMGIDPLKIMVCAIHTHTGYGIGGGHLPGRHFWCSSAAAKRAIFPRKRRKNMVILPQ